MHKILIYLESSNNEFHPVGLELISEVKKQTKDIAGVQVDALFLGEKMSDFSIKELKKVGIHTLYQMTDSLLKIYDTQIYTRNVNAFLKLHQYDVLLLGSTLIGRDLAPRVSAYLYTGLTADATILEFQTQKENQ